MFTATPSVPPSAYHCEISASHLPLNQPLSATLQKVMALDTKALLGDTHLFYYDRQNNSLRLSASFGELLQFLVDLHELDGAALAATQLSELNAILQKKQGEQGGLMRAEKTERFQLTDNPAKVAQREHLENLFRKIGFVESSPQTQPLDVDHCIIFGALIERMEKRILLTVEYLQNNLKVSGPIFLMGATRKLFDHELPRLQVLLEKLNEQDKLEWKDLFSDPQQCTEANAFMLLWKVLVPQDLQKQYAQNLIGINSTRTGASYNETEGHRPTTEVTIEDWMKFYKEGHPQKVFALAELPFVRLTDQLRQTTVLNTSKNSPINLQKLCQRIQQTTFYFVSSKTSPAPLVSVYLDEIGRSVFRINQVINLTFVP